MVAMGRLTCKRILAKAKAAGFFDWANCLTFMGEIDRSAVSVPEQKAEPSQNHGDDDNQSKHIDR